MATLTGQTIASSYEQLLHVDTDGGGNTTTLVPVKDGDNGTTFAMQLSTTTVCIDNPTADSSTQGGILRLQSDDGALMQSGSRLGVIEFAGAEDSSSTITVGGRIESVTDAAWSASENGADMVFYTTDGNASQSEVMRLTADNLVGIGTTAPTGGRLLTLKEQASQSAAIQFMDTDSSLMGTIGLNRTGSDIVSGSSANSMIIYNQYSGGVLQLASDGAVRLTLDSNSRISLSNNDSGADNTILGFDAGKLLTSGCNENVIIGDLAMDAADGTESYNVAIGSQAMSSVDEAAYEANGNVAIGAQALIGGAIGSAAFSGNIAIGMSALNSTTTNPSLGQIAIGHEALTAHTGAGSGNNTAIGYQSMLTATTAQNNVMIGWQTGYRCANGGAFNTIVGSKAFSGDQAGETDSDECTAVGYLALSGITVNADLNTMVGCRAGDGITTGTTNTGIGADVAFDIDANNQTAVGYGASTASTGVNTVVLGNADVTAVYMAQDKGAKVYCGQLELGTTGAGNAGVLINSSMEYYSYLAGTSSQAHMLFNNANGDVGSIDTSGTATAYNTSSDYRLKENEVTLSDGITRLKNLKPYRFNFKSDKDKTLDGFFAHEVAEVVPEAITGEKDAVDDDGNMIRQGIDHSKLVPLLVKAVQELTAKVEALEKK